MRRKKGAGSAKRTYPTEKVRSGEKYAPGQEVIFVRWKTEDRIPCRVEFVDENGYVMLHSRQNITSRYLTHPKHIL